MSTPRTIAVTGASGMIGRHLCVALQRSGWRVRALVRDPDAFQMEGVESVRFKMPDVPLPACFEGVSALVHCAATTRAKDLAGSEDVDVLGSERLLRASRAAGVSRVVFLSSVSAHEGALSRYGRSKRRIEGLLDPERDLALRLGLVVAREGGGLFERLVTWVRQMPVIPLFGGGRQVVQPIHIDDLCRALDVAVQGTICGTLVLADPDGLSLRELMDEIARRLGRRPRFLSVPFQPVLFGLTLLEKLRLPLPISSENLLGLRAQQFVPSAPDLERIGVQLRDRSASLDDVLL